MTKTIAIGTAAVVLPVRHPLHVAKLALSLDRLSGGRLLLGLGSGDRQPEFKAFGVEADERGRVFLEHWPIVRAALTPDAGDRSALLRATDGADVLMPPANQVPMLVVGSARQSLQWIASNAEAWATYHREEDRQEGRISLWKAALRAASPTGEKPFVQSLHLDLLKSPDAAPEPIELGMRTGRHGLLAYLRRLAVLGVRHTILHFAREGRPAPEVLEEIGQYVLPFLNQEGP